MRKTLVIFGHEIRIRPESDVKLHITDYVSEEINEVEKWKHTFPMEKRVNVYIQFKGFIEYVFSRYDAAILNYGETALFHLEAILRSFCTIRNKFKEKGATPEQLKAFDDKIYACFNTTIRIVNNKTLELEKIESEDLLYHIELMKKLKEFKVEEYYK
jgi:hypothetical protein